jgi:nucleotide-binding universal stress UspA family protein
MPPVLQTAARLRESVEAHTAALDHPDELVASVEHELVAAEEQKLRSYLKRQAETLAAAGLAADTRVRRGDAATEIVRCAEEEQADLVAMSTHGRTGFDHLVHGSVASAVLRAGRLPVLLVRPESAAFVHHQAQKSEQA